MINREKSILKIQDSILKILFEDTFRKILLYYLPILQVVWRESYDSALGLPRAILLLHVFVDSLLLDDL